MDLQVKLGAAANAVKGKSREERLAFAVAKKDRANELYHEGQLARAADVYLEALVGLDFGGGTAEEVAEGQRTVQLPVLCNLAACKLALGENAIVIELCNKALEVDPRCVKALLRRCRARAETEDMTGALEDLAAATEAAEGDAEEKYVRRERRMLKSSIEKLRRHRAEQRRMWSTVADANVYDDKETKEERDAAAAATTKEPVALPELEPDTDTSDDEAAIAAGPGGLCARLVNCCKGLFTTAATHGKDD